MATKYGHFKRQPGEETGTWLRSMHPSSVIQERRPDMAMKYGHFKRQLGGETGTRLCSMDTSSDNLERRLGHNYERETLKVSLSESLLIVEQSNANGTNCIKVKIDNTQ